MGTAYTSNQAGDWGTSTVWTPNGIPSHTTSDTVSIGHAITQNSAQSIGASSAAGGTAAITITSGGSLASNASFDLYGEINFTAPITTPLGWTLAAGVTLTVHVPASQAYNLFFFGGMCGLVCNGTSGSHCVVTASLGSGASCVINVGSGGSARTQGLQTATYTDFSNFGTTSNYGIVTQKANTVNSDPSITNCTFTNCSYEYLGGQGVNQSGVFTFSDNVFSSSVLVSTREAEFLAGTADTTIGTLDSNTFSASVEFTAIGAWVIQNNVMPAAFNVASINGTGWTTFDNNLVLSQAPNATPLLIGGGTMTNNYVNHTSSTGSDPQGFGIPTAVSSCTWSKNVYELSIGGSARGGVLFPGSPAGVQPNICEYNIILPTPSGNGSGSLYVAGGTNANLRLTCRHNTWCGNQSTQGGMTWTGEGGTDLAGTFVDIRGNLCWSSAASATNLASQSTATSPTLNDVSTPGISYNGYQNPTAGTCTIGGVSTSTPGLTGFNVNNGSIDVSHDVVGNPGFVDSTRNFLAWGTHKGIGSPTVTNVTAYIANPANGTQAALITDLRTWVQNGFRPTNTAFQAVSYPGDSSSFDAAGNAWAAGSPDLGAMAVLTSAPAATGASLLMGM